MSVISLIIVLAVLGLVVWLITTYVPMDGGIKKVIRISGVVIAILYLLHALGIFGGIGGMRVPTIR